MKIKPLVSVIIISYKSYNYIYQAIDSVLSQDYSNIELIINNDGSADFDKESIINYTKKYSQKNIKNIIVNNNSTNVGTVKNANIALKLSHGKYILLFAADDAIYDKYVVSKFVDSFAQLPEKEMIITSQLGMYNVNLKKLIQPFVSKKHIKLIETLSPHELFGEMATKCIIPACSTCYKREIFEKYGYFDEKYILVEDYSSALKFSRLGIKFNYFDFMSFKHRDGGVSHGNIKGQNTISKQYELDIINILKYEILPYLKYLNKKQLYLFNKKLRNYVWEYKYKYEYENSSKNQKRKFIIDNFGSFLGNFTNNFTQDAYDQLRGKKAKLCLIGVILLIFYKTLGLFIIFVAIFLIILYLIKKYLPKLIRLLKFIL